MTNLVPQVLKKITNSLHEYGYHLGLGIRLPELRRLFGVIEDPFGFDCEIRKFIALDGEIHLVLDIETSVIYAAALFRSASPFGLQCSIEDIVRRRDLDAELEKQSLVLVLASIQVSAKRLSRERRQTVRVSFSQQSSRPDGSEPDLMSVLLECAGYRPLPHSNLTGFTKAVTPLEAVSA